MSCTTASARIERDPNGEYIEYVAVSLDRGNFREKILTRLPGIPAPFTSFQLTPSYAPSPKVRAASRGEHIITYRL